MARPSDYNKGIAALICEKLADGKSLREICSEDANMPARSTIFMWLSQHHEFADQYAHAREAQAEALVEEAKEIADDGSNDWMEKHHRDTVSWVVNGEAVQRSRLRIEHRRWAAEKLKPKVYGNKQFLEHSGGIAITGQDSEELIAEIMELVTTGRLKLPGGVTLAESDEDYEPITDADYEADDFSDLAARRPWFKRKAAKAQPQEDDDDYSDIA